REISQVTAENSQRVRGCSDAAAVSKQGFSEVLGTGAGCFLAARNSDNSQGLRSVLKEEGGDGSGRGLRLRRGAVPVDGAAVDCSRLPLPGLPETDRQCIRAQHVDREELRRRRSQPAAVRHADG